MTPTELLTKLKAKSIVDPVTDCWLWDQGKTVAGYCITGTRKKKYYTHRLAYQAAKGAIPEGLELDHLCRRRSCCNPAHLEAVTKSENVKRGLGGAHNKQKTHCPQGHEYTPENIRWYQGRRYCRTCQKVKRYINGKGKGSFNKDKNHCPQGHEYTPENTYICPSTQGRHCRECTRVKNRKRYIGP